MGLKDILIVVGSDVEESVIEAGCQLAARHGAHLTGLFVQPPPQWMVGDTYAIVIESQRRWLDEMAARVGATFQRCVERAGILPQSEWRVTEGDPTATACQMARYADLVVVMQPKSDAWNGTAGARPDDLLFGAGRPILVIPHSGAFPRVGDNVLVAWNGSSEASRALHDSLPLLREAATVNVLRVDRKPPAPRPGHYPGADIARHLARHGLDVTVNRLASDEIQPIDLILNFAADAGADLLVMGGYGHSRLRELVLGGVTASALASMTLPVLMSH